LEKVTWTVVRLAAVAATFVGAFGTSPTITWRVWPGR
jgi:hypothetical protein